MNAERGGDPQPLELDIFNLPFRLRAPVEEHQRLQRAAKHVDVVMRELIAGQPSADTTRLAIQAAFLIATDYFRSMDEAAAGGTEQAKGFGRRVDDVLVALDQALNGIGTVLPAGEPQEIRPEPVTLVEKQQLSAEFEQPQDPEEAPPSRKRSHFSSPEP